MSALIRPNAEQLSVLANCHTDRQVRELFAVVIDPAMQEAREKLSTINLDSMTYEASKLQGAIQFADELRHLMKKAREGQ